MQGRKPAIKPEWNVIDHPATEVRLPSCPPELTTETEKECWNHVSRAMVERGTYNDDCIKLAESYCLYYAKFIQENRMAKNNLGTRMGDKHFIAANHAFDRFFKIALDLGLSPVMRGRVKPARTKASGFLSGKKKDKTRDVA